MFIVPLVEPFKDLLNINGIACADIKAFMFPVTIQVK